MTYRCVSYGCSEDTGAVKRVMCRVHWRHVPTHVRGDIATHWRDVPPGSQSLEFWQALETAVRHVWRAEREERLGGDACPAGGFDTDVRDAMVERDRARPPDPQRPADPVVMLTGCYVSSRGERAFQTEDKTWVDGDAVILLRQTLQAALRLRDAVEAQDMGLTLPSSMSHPPAPGSYRALLADFDRQVHAIEGRTNQKLRDWR